MIVTHDLKGLTRRHCTEGDRGGREGDRGGRRASDLGLLNKRGLPLPRLVFLALSIAGLVAVDGGLSSNGSIPPHISADKFVGSTLLNAATKSGTTSAFTGRPFAQSMPMVTGNVYGAFAFFFSDLAHPPAFGISTNSDAC
eukprot:CAMPEP_0169306138 /NCGR_PEP_ID=MMETSP1017-20121227/547_1 /TAXON_ID=342587 /ORGANISM="Karlodinium micrum, Strain CCMP2283" /LENGTH=140 /DNA_ID=CAMNT_0009399235 /DNA_START=72 /DNA_END=494 /DNA_ORIENTATION=-